MEFDAAMRELESGDEKVLETETQKGRKAATTEAADQIEEEMLGDDVEAQAAAKAGLKVSKTEEVKAEEDTPKKEDTPEEEDEKTEAEKLAAWLKEANPAYQKRFTRLEKQNSELKAAAADRIVIQATADSPLANITTQDDLNHVEKYWNHILELTEAEGADEGCEVPQLDGKKVLLETPEQVKAWRNYARSTLRAVPDRKAILIERNSSRPWDQATKIVPDLLDKDSDANKAAVEFLQSNPAFVTKNPKTWEVLLAHMTRSQQMENEEKTGKAKWVRLALDKEGNVIFKGKKTVKPAAEVKKLPSAPNGTRPAVGVKNRQTDLAQATAAALDGSDESLDALVAATLAA